MICWRTRQGASCWRGVLTDWAQPDHAARGRHFPLTGLVLIGALKLGSFRCSSPASCWAAWPYGGVTPANVAFVSSYYGMRHYAVNLSVVVTNLLFASFGSTIAGRAVDATGSTSARAP